MKTTLITLEEKDNIIADLDHLEFSSSIELHQQLMMLIKLIVSKSKWIEYIE